MLYCHVLVTVLHSIIVDMLDGAVLKVPAPQERPIKNDKWNLKLIQLRVVFHFLSSWEHNTISVDGKIMLLMPFCLYKQYDYVNVGIRFLFHPRNSLSDMHKHTNILQKRSILNTKMLLFCSHLLPLLSESNFMRSFILLVNNMSCSWVIYGSVSIILICFHIFHI